MKIGDKVYVIGSNDIAHIVGIDYYLIWVSWYHNGQNFLNSYQIRNDCHSGYSSPYFSNTFITEKEVRKEKLKKLKEQSINGKN